MLRVVLLRGPGSDGAIYTLADWTDATATENIGRKDKQALVNAVKTGASTQSRILEPAMCKFSDPLCPHQCHLVTASTVRCPPLNV